jgi:predicted small metal-binding protein
MGGCVISRRAVMHSSIGNRLRRCPAIVNGPGGMAERWDASDSSDKEFTMPRKYIDCRQYPSETACSVAISADNDKELLEAAVQHAVSVHQHKDTPELRSQLGQLFKEGNPPLQV